MTAEKRRPVPDGVRPPGGLRRGARRGRAIFTAVPAKIESERAQPGPEPNAATVLHAFVGPIAPKQERTAVVYRGGLGRLVLAPAELEGEDMATTHLGVISVHERPPESVRRSDIEEAINEQPGEG